MAEPYCLAMVLCDAVHRDLATGKFTILGTFSTMGAKEFPSQTQFCVYFAVTDGIGPTVISLRLRESSAGISDEPGGEHELLDKELLSLPPIDFIDPLMVYEVGMHVPCEFPKKGQYHLELYANQQVLMARRLMIIASSDLESR
jgi:hypothetical protein